MRFSGFKFSSAVSVLTLAALLFSGAAVAGESLNCTNKAGTLKRVDRTFLGMRKVNYVVYMTSLKESEVAVEFVDTKVYEQFGMDSASGEERFTVLLKIRRKDGERLASVAGWPIWDLSDYVDCTRLRW